MFTHNKTGVAPDAGSSTTRSTSLRRWLRRGRTLLGLGLLLSSLTLPAGATTIYFFAPDGSSQDVSASYSYSYQQHYLYDAYTNVVGTVDDQGNIFSLTGDLIGRVVLPVAD